MAFELPDLPFSSSALSPWISEEAFSIHHGKHHAGYVKKLNAALEGNDDASESLDAIISSSRDSGEAKVFNSAAQHFNHSFFWNCLSPDASEPSGRLLEMIDRDFVSQFSGF